jgi:hypothetical protein
MTHRHIARTFAVLIFGAAFCISAFADATHPALSVVTLDGKTFDLASPRSGSRGKTPTKRK